MLCFSHITVLGFVLSGTMCFLACSSENKTILRSCPTVLLSRLCDSLHMLHRNKLQCEQYETTGSSLSQLSHCASSSPPTLRLSMYSSTRCSAKKLVGRSLTPPSGTSVSLLHLRLGHIILDSSCKSSKQSLQ